jgi:hypothetical protein
MSTESLEDMIKRYGFPHEWNFLARCANGWRLVSEAIEIRCFIDVVLHSPDPHLVKMARDKFGPHVDITLLDTEWPGKGCFEYDWDGLTRMRLKRQGEATGTCCALECGAPLSDKLLPFCDEHMKDPELLKAWEEL